jgi:hypothetical protein
MFGGLSRRLTLNSRELHPLSCRPRIRESLVCAVTAIPDFAAMSNSMNPNSVDRMELMRLKKSQEELDAEAPPGTGPTW